MTSLLIAMQVAAVVGCLIILWTIVFTARRYPQLPRRVLYPKNYGDGGEQSLPKVVIWFLPAAQIFVAGIVVWATLLRLANAPGTHGDPFVGLVVADCAMLVLFFVQRNVMLRPDSA